MREMKDSGIEWIGKIPNNWRITRIKYVCNSRSEKAFFKHETDSYLGLENVVGFSDKIIETDTTYADGYYDTYKAGDVLFNKLRPYLGKVIIASTDGFCTGEFVKLFNYQGDRRYLRYWMIDEQFITEVDNSTYGAKMPRANPEFVLNMPIPVIPYIEQFAISNYLDTKCAEIDALAADIQSQIDTLEQYKRSVITEAVTRGLDKNVEMKESGMASVSQIPKNWKITKITHILDYDSPYPIGDGDHGSISADDYVKKGIPFIRVQNLGYTKNLDLSNVVYITEEQNKKIINSTLHPGDVLFAKTGATIGKVGIVPDSLPISNTTSHVGKITISKKHSSRYFFYFLSSYVGYKQLWEIASLKSTRPELSIDEIKKLQVIIPKNRIEECEIVNYLDKECKIIDNTIYLKRQQLEKLDAYKKSLIYEYVTGKKEVPD